MFKTTCMGRKNLIGIKLRQLRAEKFPELSQRAFAEKLQLIGMDDEAVKILEGLVKNRK